MGYILAWNRAAAAVLVLFLHRFFIEIQDTATTN